MIDFRYHIVSLISVFLALAVGIILGAGPLKESIGDQLTGQVDVLRTEKDELRKELDSAESLLTSTDAFVAAAAPEVLDGVLAGRRVGVVQLGAIDDAVLVGVEAQIAAAGGTISIRTQLTDAWTAADRADSRQSYAESLTDYLGDSATTEGYDVTLSRALASAMTGADPASPDAFSSDAVLLRDLLVGGELIEVLGDPAAPADVIVVLSSGRAPVGEDDSPSDDELRAAAALQRNVVVAAQDLAEAAVLAAATPVKNGVVTIVREDESLSGSISTVSAMDRIVGQVNIPLALAARVAGEVGQFGPEEDATAIMPGPVSLEPVDRTPVLPDAGAPDPDVADPDAAVEGEG